MSEKKVIASISGGKDSLAALVTHIESGGRCDGAIYCRIMFDEKISAEYPEHEEWLHEKCFPTLEREYGVRTRIVQSEETYIEHFYRKFKRGKKVGQIYGFPSLWCPWCNSDLKVGPLERFKKTYGEYMCYIAVANNYTGSLPYLTALIAFLQAATATVLSFSLNKSKAENTTGGITYEANIKRDC